MNIKFLMIHIICLKLQPCIEQPSTWYDIIFFVPVTCLLTKAKSIFSIFIKGQGKLMHLLLGDETCSVNSFKKPCG